MEKIQRFEDIVGWQKARELVRIIYQMNSENDGFRRDLRAVATKNSPTSSISPVVQWLKSRANYTLLSILVILTGTLSIQDS